nr:hypothetical protein CFP56_60256 [Quercus suber]
MLNDVGIHAGEEKISCFSIDKRWVLSPVSQASYPKGKLGGSSRVCQQLPSCLSSGATSDADRDDIVHPQGMKTG